MDQVRHVQERKRNRNPNCQRISIKLRVFQIYSPRYLVVVEMEVRCWHWDTLRWRAEWIVYSSKDTLQFSNCCQNAGYSLSQLSDPPPLLQHLFAGSEARDCGARQNIRNLIVLCLGEQSLEPGWTKDQLLHLSIRRLLCKDRYTTAKECWDQVLWLDPHFYLYTSLILPTVLRHNSGLRACEK